MVWQLQDGILILTLLLIWDLQLWKAEGFYNDRFIAYYFTHKLPWYFKSIGQNVSSLDFVLRGTIGDMKHPEYHDFKFKKLDHLYQEVGLEWNNFLSSYFNLGRFLQSGILHNDQF